MWTHYFQEALDVVHINKEDQQSVFAMLAAVLWLGNISFSVIDNENHVEAVADEGNTLLMIDWKKKERIYMMVILCFLQVVFAMKHCDLQIISNMHPVMENIELSLYVW